jgi:hypothetical protein
MKYIKTYDINFPPKYKYSIGDYVILKDKVLSNNIFVVDRISKTGKKTLSQKIYYHLSYLNDKRLTWIEESDIAFCSKYIKECELFLAAKKYNI